MIQECLKEIGLTDKEIEIYLSLLGLGTSPASSVGRRTNTPRSTARYICQKLAKKGLVIESNKNKTLLFTPKEPEELVEYLLNKDRRAIDHKEAILHKSLRELKGLYNPDTVLPKVRYFEGVDGVIEMLEDVFEDGASKIYGSLRLTPEDFNEDLARYLEEEYTPKRVANQQQSFAINNMNPMTIKYRENDEKVNKVTLLIPDDEYPFHQGFHMYGNKIAFFSAHNGAYYGILIDDEYTWKTQFSLFKMAWSFARALDINKKHRDLTLE